MIATQPFAGVSPSPLAHYGLLLHGAIARVRALVETRGGESLPAAGRFLETYDAALRPPGAPRSGPGGGAALADWWTRSIRHWEESHARQLPLMRLTGRAGLDTGQRIASLMPALVEEDGRFGDLFTHLQGSGPWPTVQLLGHQDGGVETGVSDPWSRCRPLLELGLLQVGDTRAPRARMPLCIPPLVMQALRGELGRRPAPGMELLAPGAFPALEALVLPDDWRETLANAAAAMVDGCLETLVLRGGAGEQPRDLAGALAKACGLGLLHFAAGSESRAPMPDGPLLGALCALARVLPLVELGGSAGVDLGALPPPRILCLDPGVEPLPALPGDALVLEIPELTAPLRRRVWSQALNGVPADLDAIAGAFQLSAGHIPGAARRVRHLRRASAGERVGVAEVRRALADLNRHQLSGLADPIPARGHWGDLITNEATGERLRELVSRCRHRERLTGSLGRGFGNSGNRGVRALFSGVSGTGKTLAARILAAELGLDLFRVDLAGVVNKYIGETEKNLRQVLGRAESLDVVLLLDEGDSLLGGRTEVRSANDRYANLQTNYLLQRLEHYQGILVVTTNLAENVDRAFRRRMDVVVPFAPPRPQERLAILRLHLPADHQVGAACLEALASRCALSGGQLRNCVMMAGLLALDGGVPLGDAQLLDAVRREYRKAGAACPLPDTANLPDIPAPGAEDAAADPYLLALAAQRA
jgi:hypothetical protein